MVLAIHRIKSTEDEGSIPHDTILIYETNHSDINYMLERIPCFTLLSFNKYQQQQHLPHQKYH